MKRTSKFPHVDEREVVAAVLRAVDWASDGIRLYRQNVAAFNVHTTGYKSRFVQCGEVGQSDINGIVKTVVCPCCNKAYRTGVRLEIECKTRKGKLTDHQEHWIAAMHDANAIAFVVRPEPCDEDPTGLNHKRLRRRILQQIHTLCRECRQKLETPR